ncbi:MAG: EF-P lysine aminoacylase EpmA [Gammaproteobacteria bacterium]|nr:EF-P lysine aminoacylase EpmA [Gammaproteobacteria bacterium]
MKSPDHHGIPCLEALQARAKLYARVRDFFAARDVLEVETPILNPHTVTDPHIESIGVSHDDRRQYLHTSPEHAMKRLLVSLRCDIYQLCKVFRAGETGRFHHPEFTMLEWYRVGWSYQELMREVEQLVMHLLPGHVRLLESRAMGYREAFLRYCGLDPWTARTEDYRIACRDAGLAPSTQYSCADYQALLLDQVIAQRLPADRLTFIYDFPVQLASLARIDSEGRAQRFELYVGNLELANGYQELTDAGELVARFEQDNKERSRAGKRPMEPDPCLVEALREGLPDCAGVALGIDRLLMLITGADRISDVLAPRG